MNTAKQSVKTAFCGVLSALAVVFLLLVPVVPILLYCSPVLAGMCVAIAAEEFGRGYGAGVFISSSVLSVLIAADKESVAVYVLLTGGYALLRCILKDCPFAFRLAVKLLYINAASAAYYFASILLLGIPADSFGPLPWLLLIAANLIMLMYDKALENCFVIYNKKIKNRLMKGKW